MAKNIKISEPDENFIRYPKVEVGEEGSVEKNTEIPDNRAKNERKKKELLRNVGVTGGFIGVVAGLMTGSVLLANYLFKKPFREGSYQCSLRGWKLKSVVGEDYVKLNSAGTLETYIYTPGFLGGLDKQVEFIDSNLDGLVDEVTIYKSFPAYCPVAYRPVNHMVRGKDNSAAFEKVDQKYRHYKEELADLIAKAEKAWFEQ